MISARRTLGLNASSGKRIRGKWRRPVAALAAALLSAKASMAQSPIAPDQLSPIRASIANRIEALAILGGDFGFSDGDFTLTGLLIPGVRTDTRLSVEKFGGAGDVGDPRQLDGANIGWQARLQGSMGYLNWTDELHSPLLDGDRSEFTAKAIEFGGGVRFWVSESLSFAPTLMGMYGHTNDGYFPKSVFTRVNLNQLQELGLIDWEVDVWSIRPALNTQYLVQIDRALLTLSSDLTYFHTQGFNSSNAHLTVDGNSGFATDKLDIDIPLGVEIEGHELRSGGYVARTDLFGDLESGLGVQHLSEIHARVVLDFLSQWWKLRWLGIGASYIWGTSIHGWTAGADAAFRF